MTEKNLKAYLGAACWAEPGDGDAWRVADVSPGSVLRARRELSVFIAACQLAGISFSKLPNWETNFWLTRQRHGAGFQDGGRCPEEYEEALVALCDAFGELDCYRGDNGEVYLGEAW